MACGWQLRRKRIDRASNQKNALRKFRYRTKTKNPAMKLLFSSPLESLLNAAFPLVSRAGPPRGSTPSSQAITIVRSGSKLLNKGLLTALRARFAFNRCSELGRRRTLPAAWSPSSPEHALLGAPSGRPGVNRDSRDRLDPKLGRSHPGVSSRRHRPDPSRSEALTWSIGDLVDDSHRDPGGEQR